MKKLISKILFCAVVSMFTAYPAFAAEYAPLKGLSVVIDPGHGGKDSGAVGKYGLKESETNLRVAKYLKTLLQADGAGVVMTRDTDEYLSLAERAKIASKAAADIFISVHHNASLNPRTETRGEIFYASRDMGFSKLLGEAMLEQLKLKNFGAESVAVPGGFYVLRETNTASILTEGAYISIPETELKLMSGKMLTDEANLFRRAIRQAYSKYIRIKFLVDANFEIDSPFFIIPFVSDKPITKANVRLLPNSSICGLSVERLSPFPGMYIVYNKKPLSSGDYRLEILCEDNNGRISTASRQNIKIKLPASELVIMPAAPYIPQGFKGKFPFIINAIDAEKCPNAVESKIKCSKMVPAENNSYKLASMIGELASVEPGCLYYPESTKEILTDKYGAGVFFIDLTGSEEDSVSVRAEFSSDVTKTITVPVKKVSSKFILGQVADENDFISGVKITCSDGSETISSTGGYFFLEPSTSDFTLTTSGKSGYESKSFEFKNILEPVRLPVLDIEQSNPNIYGKGFAVSSTPKFTAFADSLASKLALAGAAALRLHRDESAEQPMVKAVIKANELPNVKGLISIKESQGNKIEFRHYYSSKIGIKTAKAAAKFINKAKIPFKARALAASEYETHHAAAVVVVVALPKKLSGKDLNTVVDAVYKAIVEEF